jgi:hypothetical protein
MSKIFEFDLTTKPQNLLEQAKVIAEGYGAFFQIKNDYGKFYWKGIRGSLRIHDSKITITILDKPFIIPWGFIEKIFNQIFRKKVN